MHPVGHGEQMLAIRCGRHIRLADANCYAIVQRAVTANAGYDSHTQPSVTIFCANLFVPPAKDLLARVEVLKCKTHNRRHYFARYLRQYHTSPLPLGLVPEW